MQRSFVGHSSVDTWKKDLFFHQQLIFFDEPEHLLQRLKQNLLVVLLKTFTSPGWIFSVQTLNMAESLLLEGKTGRNVCLTAGLM